jgi:hypothetical protein
MMRSPRANGADQVGDETEDEDDGKSDGEDDDEDEDEEQGSEDDEDEDDDDDSNSEGVQGDGNSAADVAPAGEPQVDHDSDTNMTIPNGRR